MAGKSFIFRFADVEVREREFSLAKAGEVLPVEPKAFRPRRPWTCPWRHRIQGSRTRRSQAGRRCNQDFRYSTTRPSRGRSWPPQGNGIRRRNLGLRRQRKDRNAECDKWSSDGEEGHTLTPPSPVAGSSPFVGSSVCDPAGGRCHRSWQSSRR